MGVALQRRICCLQNNGHFVMMTSSNGNIFHVTDPLCGEFTCHQWIPLTKPSDANLWCFLWSAPAQTIMSWRRCPTYGRDVVSYCYLRFCNFCRPPCLTSSCVGLNVCSLAYLVLVGHLKGNCICFCLTQSVATSCHKNESHSTSS